MLSTADDQSESDSEMMILTGKNRRTRRKTCPSATFCTTDPTRIGPEANPSIRGERPAIKRLSHETTLGELTLTPFNSISLNLTEFTAAVNNLAAMVTMEHNPNPQFSNAHVTNLILINIKIIETMGLKITAWRPS
jgi:hypothetical protein